MSITNLLKRVAGVKSATRPPEPAVGPEYASEQGPSAPVGEPESAEPVVDGWDDDEVLLDFGFHNILTIRHTLSGCAIFGETGSGKTSGSGARLARAMLRAGYGGLILCVKPDEAALWQRYAAEAGRSDDLVLFGSDPRLRFNFLDYEARRPGVGSGLTENLIQLFVEVCSIGNGEVAGGKGDDPFWDRAMRSLVRNLIDLLMLAKQPITLPAMFDLLRSAPLEVERIESQSWHDESFCARVMKLAEAATKGTSQENDYVQVRAYWFREFPSMPDKTRGSVVELFRTMAESLMRGTMRSLFCDGPSTLIPEHALAGKIIVIDLPVKVWGEVGRYAGVLWKYCFQKAVERRIDNADGRARPVTLWVDECQFFSSKNDYLFQTTARSSRVATVYLTQTMSGLLTSLGGEVSGKARVDALVANLTTKIFHANSDHTTNQWAADLIGRERLRFHSINSNFSFSAGTPSASYGSATNEQMDYRLQPTVFTELKKGGPENGLIVQAIVFQTGRVWSEGGRQRNWLLAHFYQD